MDDRPPRILPFGFWWPLIGGTGAGLLLRFVFSGEPGSPFATMMGSFIYLTPVVVGAVTVYLAERIERRSWGYYFGAPFLANVFFVTGTLLIMIEGIICAILIVPLFSLFGALGGLAMGVVCRLTNWPKQTLYSVAMLPLILGVVEADLPLPQRVREVQRSLLIEAPAAVVWDQIHNVRDIQSAEVDDGWVYRIGVPAPLAGVTRGTGRNSSRRITMGKNVYFDQLTTNWEEERYVRWVYRFYPDSFPPNALDDHVMVGGHYFDIIDTSYALAAQGQSTELTMLIRYRVSTRFNWYAGFLAQLLLGDLEETLLELYRHRAEATPS